MTSSSATADLAHEAHDPSHITDDTPTLVLLGSLGSDRSMWSQQIRELSKLFRVIAIDHRGHGDSAAIPGPCTIKDLAGDVLTLLDFLDVDRFHVAGLSLGGAVAQWLAVHHPDRIQSIALLCTAARFGEPQGWVDRAATVQRDGVGAVVDAVVARWITPALAERDPRLVATLRKMVLATDGESYAACCDALSAFDLRADLGRIGCPALVAAGDQDPSTPPELVREIADGIEDARWEILSPAAHVPTVELPGRVTALLRDHVLSSSGGTAYMAGRTAAYDAGMRRRREVLGDAHVDRSVAGTTDFTAPFQDFITRTAWGDVWTRPGLDETQRRLLTIAVLTALGNDGELDMHLRAALRAGVPSDLIAEVLLHTAIYAGVPKSNHAFALGKAALADLAEPT